MSPNSPVWLMQLQYKVESYLYPELCTARDCFMILRLISFQFNALSRGSQRPKLPYKMALLEVMGWNILHNLSPENITCWLLLGSLLLNYYLMHIDILSCKSSYSARCTNQKQSVTAFHHFMKPNLFIHSHFLLCSWISIFSIPKHSRRPSRSTLPTFLEGLKKPVEPYSVQDSRLRLECEASNGQVGTLCSCP